MSSGPSGPNGGQGGGNQPSYLPTPGMPGQGTYGAGYQAPGGTNVGYANMTPYQQGMTPQQIQAGLGKLTQGMGLAKQSYDKMGQMGDQFQNNANNAGNAQYNPAIGAYQQALNQNSQNIGAQLASQRGASADPGLAARNVGQAGAVAAQNAAGQMSSQVAQYKLGNQQAAAGAYQGQGQMAGIYGNIANAYSQAGLANQGQQLNAIAAQNAANVAMQSNVNSSNVAMQSNINSANVAMQSNVNDVMAQQMMNNNNLQMQGYGMQLGYNSNLYNSYMGEQGSARAGGCTGGLFGGGGFLGLGFSLSQGGEVGKHGKPKVIETTGRTISDKKAAFARAMANVPKYAKGGRIPEPKRRAMAEGGYVKRYDEGGDVESSDAVDKQTDQQDQQLSSMGGGQQSPYSLGTNLNLMQALGQNDQNVMNQSASSGPQAPASTVGKIMSGLMQLQGNNGFNHGPSGGGGGCGTLSGIGNAVAGAQGSLAQGNGALTGAMSGLFGGSGGAAAAGAGSAGDAAAALAAAHGGRIQQYGRGGPVAQVPHVGGQRPPMIRPPGIRRAAQGGQMGGMPSHVTVPVAALRKLMDMAHVGKQAMQQKARGGVIRAAQGAIIPQTQNPNMPGSMTPNIAMQSNINGMANQGGMLGMGGGQPQQPQQGGGFMGAGGQQGDGMANQGQIAMQSNIGNVQAQGPGMQNMALAGSPNQQVAMPSTGMPMGNAQTNGQPMPGMGMSSNIDPSQQKKRQPGQPFAYGGRVNPYGRRS